MKGLERLQIHKNTYIGRFEHSFYGLSSKRQKKIIGNATTKATLTVLANLVKVRGWPDQNRGTDHDGQIFRFLKVILCHVLHVQNLEENNPKG